MGLYQLLSPVLSLSFSLCAAAYQTSISKFVAEYTKEKAASFKPLWAGLFLSIPLSMLCCGFLYCYADFIAKALLSEPRCTSMLRILAFSIPFSSIHACINGYFYGVKRTGPPAVSQLLEQLTRVGCVYLITGKFLSQNLTPPIDVAVIGLAVGELVSMCICITAIFQVYAGDSLLSQKRDKSSVPGVTSLHTSQMINPILKMALPLTLNRIVLNLLQSIEAVSIPAKLRLYGYDAKTALSVYGVFTGMALPMIFFPNALTNSVSVLLLPFISENYASQNLRAVKSAIRKNITFCITMGTLCMTGFLLLGDFIGTTFFDSAQAGHFIKTLSFLCPFLYLDMTLSSVLQGLGKAGSIFFINATALLLRLGFVFFAIPKWGIRGYLFGMLVCQILLSILYLLFLSYFFQSIHKNRHKKSI